MGKARITNVYGLAAIACIGGSLFGFDISSMSAIIGTEQYINYFNNPSSSVQGGITAAMPGGSFLGALVSGAVSDKLGRKGALHTGVVCWLIGCIIVTASQNVAMLVVGRLINGFCVGICSAQVPVYISELAKANIRGRLTGLQQWAITWGILIMFYISYGCSFISSTASFRVPWALQAIPAILLSSLLMFCPESPRWLANHGRWDEALEVLADIHANGNKDDVAVAAEAAELREAVQIDQAAANMGYFALFEPKMWYRTHLAVWVQIWSQLTGMNVMMYYISYVFSMAGYEGNANLVASSIQYVINVIMTIPGLILLDYVGRRKLLLVGAVMMFTCLSIVGGVMGSYGSYWGDSGISSVRWRVQGPPSKAVIAFTYLFVASYAPTWGPAGWVYAPEVFPNHLRAKGMSLAACGNWAFNFALAYFVPPSFANTQWRTYFIFASFCAAMFIHVFFCFHETKGLSLEELNVMFETDIPAWKSSSYKPSRADIETVQHRQGSFGGSAKEDVGSDKKLSPMNSERTN